MEIIWSIKMRNAFIVVKYIPFKICTFYNILSKENKISSQAEASIQVGAYGSQSAAQDVVKSLEGVGSVRIVPVRVNGRNIYRVRVGPFKDMSEASQVEKEILARGFQGVRLLMD